jgi:hypothetical protein
MFRSRNFKLNVWGGTQIICVGYLILLVQLQWKYRPRFVLSGLLEIYPESTKAVKLSPAMQAPWTLHSHSTESFVHWL